MINCAANATADVIVRGSSPAAQAAGRRLIPARRNPQHWSADRASRAALIQALDMMPDAVFFLNADLRIVEVNATAARSSGYRGDELRGMQLDALILDDPNGGLLAAVQRLLCGEAQHDMLYAQQRSKGGDVLDVQVQLHVVDQEAEPLFVALVQDAGDERNDQGMVRDEARDYLTALPTRAALEFRLRRAERRARRKRSRFAVLFIDVDRFKSVNDTEGHRMGDLVLQTFGQRLLSCVRPGDFVARYGGDEFVALVEDVRSDAEVEGIAQRIRDALVSPIDRPGSPLQVTASLGVAIGQASSSADELLDEADREMYRAKRKHARSRDLGQRSQDAILDSDFGATSGKRPGVC